MESSKYTIQTLAKKHLNNYIPTFNGIIFNGKEVYLMGNSNKKLNITSKDANKFKNEVEQLYVFTPSKNVIFEELITDNDSNVYYVKRFGDNGFELYTD